MKLFSTLTLAAAMAIGFGTAYADSFEIVSASPSAGSTIVNPCTITLTMAEGVTTYSSSSLGRVYFNVEKDGTDYGSYACGEAGQVSFSDGTMTITFDLDAAASSWYNAPNQVGATYTLTIPTYALSCDGSANTEAITIDYVLADSSSSSDEITITASNNNSEETVTVLAFESQVEARVVESLDFAINLIVAPYENTTFQTGSIDFVKLNQDFYGYPYADMTAYMNGDTDGYYWETSVDTSFLSWFGLCSVNPQGITASEATDGVYAVYVNYGAFTNGDEKSDTAIFVWAVGDWQGNGSSSSEIELSLLNNTGEDVVSIVNVWGDIVDAYKISEFATPIQISAPGATGLGENCADVAIYYNDFAEISVSCDFDAEFQILYVTPAESLSSAGSYELYLPYSTVTNGTISNYWVSFYWQLEDSTDEVTEITITNYNNQSEDLTSVLAYEATLEAQIVNTLELPIYIQVEPNDAEYNNDSYGIALMQFNQDLYGYPIADTSWDMTGYYYECSIQPVGRAGLYSVIPYDADGNVLTSGDITNGVWGIYVNYEAFTYGDIVSDTALILWEVTGSSSIADSGIAAENALVDIYNLQGMCVAKSVKASAVTSLPAGIYVVNGKKLRVR